MYFILSKNYLNSTFFRVGLLSFFYSYPRINTAGINICRCINMTDAACFPFATLLREWRVGAVKKNFQSHSHLLLDDQKQSVLTQRNVAGLLEVHLLRNRSGELKKIKKIISPTGAVFNRMKIFVNLKSIQLI